MYIPGLSLEYEERGPPSPQLYSTPTQTKYSPGKIIVSYKRDSFSNSTSYNLPLSIVNLCICVAENYFTFLQKHDDQSFLGRSFIDDLKEKEKKITDLSHQLFDLQVSLPIALISCTTGTKHFFFRLR